MGNSAQVRVLILFLSGFGTRAPSTRPPAKTVLSAQGFALAQKSVNASLVERDNIFCFILQGDNSMMLRAVRWMLIQSVAQK
jgi:hypothetical protein